jgi:16S rRNA (guanine966-N2)-methyltransferase
MRIIAGKLKGREVLLQRGARARPATGVVLETAMNLFTPEGLASGVFLDLCAGSGIVSFEAISRGAPQAVQVEIDGPTVANLKRLGNDLGVSKQVTVLRQDARRCFKTVGRIVGADAVTNVFLDPPYLKGRGAVMVHDLLSHLAENGQGVLHQDALAIARSPYRLEQQQFPGLELVEERSAGSAFLYLYRPAQ